MTCCAGWTASSPRPWTCGTSPRTTTKRRAGSTGWATAPSPATSRSTRCVRPRPPPAGVSPGGRGPRLSRAHPHLIGDGQQYGKRADLREDGVLHRAGRWPGWRLEGWSVPTPLPHCPGGKGGDPQCPQLTAGALGRNEPIPRWAGLDQHPQRASWHPLAPTEPSPLSQVTASGAPWRAQQCPPLKNPRWTQSPPSPPTRCPGPRRPQASAGEKDWLCPGDVRGREAEK